MMKAGERGRDPKHPGDDQHPQPDARPAREDPLHRRKLGREGVRPGPPHRRRFLRPARVSTAKERRGGPRVKRGRLRIEVTRSEKNRSPGRRAGRGIGQCGESTSPVKVTRGSGLGHGLKAIPRTLFARKLRNARDSLRGEQDHQSKARGQRESSIIRG
jgi:hypothetical protein